MRQPTTIAGYGRPVRVWAVCGLCLVACLNPMPDDFPNQNDRDVTVPGNNGNSVEDAPMDPGAPLTPGEAAGPVFEEMDPDPTPPAQTPVGSGGSSGGMAADAGAPESDAGP